MADDYQDRLAAWKAKQGIPDPHENHTPDELKMFAEEHLDYSKCWCTFCDAHLPVHQMRLITRRTDAYRQMFEGPGEYIPRGDRVRACAPCFKENYESETL